MLKHIFAHNILSDTDTTDVEKYFNFSERKHEKTGLWKAID